MTQIHFKQDGISSTLTILANIGTIWAPPITNDFDQHNSWNPEFSGKDSERQTHRKNDKNCSDKLHHHYLTKVVQTGRACDTPSIF